MEGSLRKKGLLKEQAPPKRDHRKKTRGREKEDVAVLGKNDVRTCSTPKKIRTHRPKRVEGGGAYLGNFLKEGRNVIKKKGRRALRCDLHRRVKTKERGWPMRNRRLQIRRRTLRE